MKNAKIVKRMWKKWKLPGESLKVFAKKMVGAYNFKPARGWIITKYY